MLQIAAKLYDKYTWRLAIPTLILTILSMIPISRLEFEAGFGFLLPPDDEYEVQVARAEETFGTNELITLAIDVPELFRPSDLEEIERITNAVRDIEGTGFVISLTTMADMYLVGDSLDQLPIYRPDEDPDLSMLRERILSTPLFRDLFVSADGKAVFSYVVPAEGVSPVDYAERLVATLGNDTIRFFGDSVLKTMVVDAVSRGIVILGALALAIVLALEIVITRSVLVGLALAFVSAVPALWTVALVNLIGQAVDTVTLMVPVIVLVLATSYSVHVYRYHSLQDGTMTNTLAHIAKVVVSAALTTVAGFVSLLVTPSAILQRLGALIIFGIFAALFSSLTLLPTLLVALKGPIDRSRRRMSRGGVRSLIERSDPARPRLRLAIAGLLFLPFVIAVPFIKGGYSTRDAFRAGSQVDQTVRYFEERSQANQQMEVALYTDEQYALVSLETYQEIRNIEQRLEQEASSRRVISYGDFVEWLLGRLSGSVEPIAPESDQDIGEAMELLSGEGVGQIFDALVDPNWQDARMFLQVSFPRIGSARSGRTAEELIGQMNEIVSDAPAISEGGVLGEPVANLRHIEYLARSQLISIVVFLPILVVFLMIAFRSIVWAVITLLPTIVGLCVYFGTVSLFGYLHDPIHVFMVAGLMGVSNDDVLYFIIVFREQARSHPFSESLANTMRRTGVAIIQTTLIIVGGIATFYSSDFVLLARAALVATVSLIAASAVTLFVIPSILKLSPRLVKRLATRPPTATEVELR